MASNRTYSDKTIKELYARSGNKCAFQTCNENLFIENNVNVSAICHINGLNKGSARYCSEMSVNELNDIENLILLCQNHHKVVDSDPKKYSVDVLLQMKKAQEKHNIHNDNIAYIKSDYAANNPNEIDEVIKFINKFQDDYEYTSKNVNKAINKIAKQKQNTKIVLAKIISIYNEYKEIKMLEVLNELDCYDYNLAYELQLLESMGFIEEVEYTANSINSYISSENGGLDDVSQDYILKLYNGTWLFTKKGEILFYMYKYLGGTDELLCYLK